MRARSASLRAARTRGGRADLQRASDPAWPAAWIRRTSCARVLLPFLKSKKGAGRELDARHLFNDKGVSLAVTVKALAAHTRARTLYYG